MNTFSHVIVHLLKFAPPSQSAQCNVKVKATLKTFENKCLHQKVCEWGSFSNSRRICSLFVKSFRKTGKTSFAKKARKKEEERRNNNMQKKIVKNQLWMPHGHEWYQWTWNVSHEIKSNFWADCSLFSILFHLFLFASGCNRASPAPMVLGLVPQYKQHEPP